MLRRRGLQRRQEGRRRDRRRPPRHGALRDRPAGARGRAGPGSKLRASKPAQQAAKGNATLLNVKLRYKAPDGDTSKLITTPAEDEGHDFSAASTDFRFASSVAGFGMLLRTPPTRGRSPGTA